MKRKTKAQRGDEAKAALRRRVLDVALGASGGYQGADPESEDFPGFAADLGIEAFGRYCSALKEAFGAERHDPGEAKVGWFHFEPRNLDTFDSLEKTVDLLYGQGVRA